MRSSQTLYVFPRRMSAFYRNCPSLPELHKEDCVLSMFPSTLAGRDFHVLVDAAIEALEDGVMDVLVDGVNIAHVDCAMYATIYCVGIALLDCITLALIDG